MIYVPTDTYWIEGAYNPDILLQGLVDIKNCMYEKVADGCLGSYYLLKYNLS